MGLGLRAGFGLRALRRHPERTTHRYLYNTRLNIHLGPRGRQRLALRLLGFPASNPLGFGVSGFGSGFRVQASGFRV